MLIATEWQCAGEGSAALRHRLIHDHKYVLPEEASSAPGSGQNKGRSIRFALSLMKTSWVD